MSSRKRKPKAKATSIKETWWFNKPVFFGMFFLTFSSLISSCSMMQMLAEVEVNGTRVEVVELTEGTAKQIESIQLKIEKEQDWVGEIFLSCNQPDDEDFMQCARVFYQRVDDGFKWFIAN